MILIHDPLRLQLDDPSMFQAAEGFGIPNSLWAILILSSPTESAIPQRGSLSRIIPSRQPRGVLHIAPFTDYSVVCWRLIGHHRALHRPNQANLASLTSQTAGTTGTTLLENFLVPHGEPVIRGSISSTSRELNKIEPRLFGFSAIGYTDTIVRYSTCCGIFIWWEPQCRRQGRPSHLQYDSATAE